MECWRDGVCSDWCDHRGPAARLGGHSIATCGTEHAGFAGNSRDAIGRPHDACTVERGGNRWIEQGLQFGFVLIVRHQAGQ